MCRLNDMNRVIEVQTWANKGKMPYTQSYLSGVIVSLNQRCNKGWKKSGLAGLFLLLCM